MVEDIGFMSSLISNFKWAWQAHFLSHSPVTLEDLTSFQDGQMIIVLYFEIPHGYRLAKNDKSLCVQVIPRSTPSNTHLTKGPLLRRLTLES